MGSMGPGESELKQSRLMWSIIPVTNVKLSAPRVVAQEGAFPYQVLGLPPSSTEENSQNSTIGIFAPQKAHFTLYPPHEILIWKFRQSKSKIKMLIECAQLSNRFQQMINFTKVQGSISASRPVYT